MSINPYLKAVGSSDQIRDYAHADRVFRTDAFRLHPKFSFLYYVRINLDPNFSMLSSTSQKEIGALVKTVSLPKFNIETKTLNAYNRVNLVQTKLKYDPVIIKFHDDAADIIRKFWYDYYSFYYRDSDHPTSLYQQGHKYNLRQTDQWGYGLRGSGAGQGAGKEVVSPTTQLITDIQIFSFQGKKFSEVTLHNPIISSFRHGDHDYAQGTGILEHEMTVAYETVTYGSGFFTQDNFGSDLLLKYDRNPSPITPPDIGGVPGTDVLYQDGQLIRATGSTNVYREGSTEASSGYSVISGAGGPQVKSSNSVFATAGKAILGGMISSAIRGRNPLSQFSAQNASSILYQAGSAVGGPLGSKIIASGGLVKAGQSIMRNGVGPGNFGTVAVAVRSLGALGVRPESLVPNGVKNIFSNKATTNGAPVAQKAGATPGSSTTNFPRVSTPANNTTSSYYSTRTYSDGNPTTINDSRDSTPPSNQGRPGGGFGRFV